MFNTNKALLGRKIIVVSDDLSFLKEVEEALENVGAEAINCQNADDGLNSIKSYNPDLVILSDSDDPYASWDTDNLVKKFQQTTASETPIVFLSNKNTEKYLKDDSNIEQILPKDGIDITKLVGVVGNILASKETAKSGESFDITEMEPAPINKTKDGKMKVLIIEDDPLLSNLLSIRFTKSRVPFRFCHDGIKALEELKEFKPSLVILDIMLPGKNGLDVLKEMRDLPEFQETPVIVFTNKDDDNDRKLANALGAKDFLVKATTNLNDLIKLTLDKHVDN